MKKLFALILAAAACVSLLAGCGSSESSSLNVDPAKLADDVLAALAPAGELVEVGDSVLSNYYTVDSNVVKAYKIYVSSAWTAEEVAVFQLANTDQATMDAAESMIQQRIDSLTSSFDGYLPEELAILEENSIIYRQGDIICFVSGSADGVASAMKVLREACE